MYNKNCLEAGVAAVNQAYMQPSLDEQLLFMREASQVSSFKNSCI
jgi:hypothetical protein